MQVCKGLCLLCALSSPLKRRLRRKTGGNSSVPCRNGRASSPRHLSECKHLAAPSGSTERNVHLLLYLGLMRTQLILCLDPGDTRLYHWQGGAACHLQGGASRLNFEGGYFLAFKRLWWTDRAFSNVLPQKFIPMWTPTDWWVKKRVKPPRRKIMSTITLKKRPY